MGLDILTDNIASEKNICFLADIIGTLGMFLVVTAYFGLEIGFFSRLQLRYYLLNFFGALFLLTSLLIHFNLGSFIIELFWIAISLMGIIRCIQNNTKMKQTD